MPVGTKAITPTIPYTQPKPGENGKHHGNQVPFTGTPEHPAGYIEYCKCRMKNKKENI